MDTVVSGESEKRELVDMKLKGLSASIVQHEVDHLDGVVFTDKMQSLSLNHDDWMKHTNSLVS